VYFHNRVIIPLVRVDVPPVFTFFIFTDLYTNYRGMLFPFHRVIKDNMIMLSVNLTFRTLVSYLFPVIGIEFKPVPGSMLSKKEVRFFYIILGTAVFMIFFLFFVIRLIS
jgi:hypothetical protein